LLWRPFRHVFQPGLLALFEGNDLVMQINSGGNLDRFRIGGGFALGVGVLLALQPIVIRPARRARMLQAPGALVIIQV
jgi:hypothetical protein